MDWTNIKRFNFTWAIDGGAWIEDSTGYRNWEPYSVIVRNMGTDWWQKQIAKQGMFTGCWIDC